MTTPIVAQKSPYATDVEAGKTYYWCACGRSAKQPFCDGSHKDTGFAPTPYKADASKKVWFCGCKASGNGVMCDGTHNKI